MSLSEKFHRYCRAGFGVGEGVVMMLKLVVAGGGDGLELVVGEAASEVSPRGQQCVVEWVIRVIHLIDAVNGLQASLVKTRVVCDQRETFNKRRDLFPDIRENRRIVGITRPQPVHALAKPAEILRLRMDQRVERIHHHAAAHDYDPYAAYTAGLLVRRLEIYRCKIIHSGQAWL